MKSVYVRNITRRVRLNARRTVCSLYPSVLSEGWVGGLRQTYKSDSLPGSRRAGKLRFQKRSDKHAEVVRKTRTCMKRGISRRDNE